MGSLADEIERYIKERLENSRKRAVRLNRKQLARMFDCVPSQINYVLSTRFSAERGYYVESRRGGGGYLLITRVPISGNEGVLDLINSIPKQISQKKGRDLIQRLYEEGILTKREALLMRAVIKRETLILPPPEGDILRGYIIRAMLQTILREEFQN